MKVDSYCHYRAPGEQDVFLWRQIHDVSRDDEKFHSNFIPVKPLLSIETNEEWFIWRTTRWVTSTVLAGTVWYVGLEMERSEYDRMSR